ncbi:glycosyltransferase family 2 protein [Methylomonas fluvii]|uniref:Glycosyltransferase 2-like domain-containing protein n=1 Tax=Methylomonas fluvii TaxID=1854564 RepID=A0ABR9DH04_9GAMM|nr:hypothetical protein [Methylomonas fluvii]MBD9362215.1 hypothetical protein [Methylomonas fluvii]CAD6875261.1 Beta-hydroxylase [Methylomonas fluvii]
MKNALISLLLPSRGRLQRANDFLQSVLENSEYPEYVEVIVYLDEDDFASHSMECPGLTIKRIIGPRATMGAYNTACYEMARGDIIVLANDDMIIRTCGWDSIIRQLHDSIPDRIYLAYGNDLFKKGNLCTFPILSRKTCEILQEPFPMVYKGAFIDYHLMDIFKRLEKLGLKRIRYLPELIFEHMHYRAGKAPMDDTYRQRGRFADDGDFLSLITMRANSARALSEVNQKETVPATLDDCVPSSVPHGMVGVARYITRFIFLDKGLPLRWRLSLWIWFLGRQLAAHGLLKPFV